MASDKKNKIRARLPRGFADRGPAELAATRDMIEKIRAVYERYGFDAVETPAIEYTETLGKFLPDQDRPGEGVFSFQDDDEQWLSLRYDLTAPLARYVAENFQNLALPYRSYRHGWVFRNEKPGPGRFRQFMQFDADTVGSASVAADAEMCMLAADTLEALGIKRGDYVIKVNNRKILDGLRASISKVKPISDSQWLTVMRAIDKLDRLTWEGIEALLGKGRKDSSGDFTPGADLDAWSVQRIKDFLFVTTGPGIQHYQSKQESSGDYVEGDELVSNLDTSLYFSNINTVVGLESIVGDTEAGEEALRELEQIFKLTSAARYGSKRIRFDASVVRGLEYYTGPVYEAELTFEVKDEKGNPVRFGSVAGGGRYDDLVARFTGQPVPATGFSIGVSRLMAALKHLGKIDEKAEYGPVVVTIFDGDRVADYQRMVKSLRDAGIRAELYLGNPKNFGNQLKYADKRNSPCAVIQGGDEKAKGEVQIKDLIEGKKAADAIASNKEWRKSRAAQFSVPEDKLVEAVRQVLARHEIR